MIMNGSKVNLKNYEQVLKGYSKDVLDVVRGAILDDIDISKYIQKCKNNPYLLWQIKLALEEGLEGDWLGGITDGRVLEGVRGLDKDGYSVKSFLKILGEGYTWDVAKYLFSWYRSGCNLDSYDFAILPDGLLPVFDWGIRLGYPMHLFNTGLQYSPEYIRCCVKILSNRHSIQSFLDEIWDIFLLKAISEYSSSALYGEVIPYITKDATPSIVEGLFDCCKIGMNLEELAVLGSDGLYLYSYSQLDLLRDAFKSNLDYSEMLGKADFGEMLGVYNLLLLDSQKRLSGRL